MSMFFYKKEEKIKKYIYNIQDISELKWPKHLESKLEALVDRHNHTLFCEVDWSV